MEYEVRPLLAKDEPILREMLYQGLSSIGNHQPPREILQRPEFAHYADGWGRAGDTGFVANDNKDGSLLGAVWLRKPIDKSHAPPELAFAVKPEHRRHGIGTSLLTQLVRANPEQSTISLSFVTGKPVLRLYERFGFKVVEEQPAAMAQSSPGANTAVDQLIPWLLDEDQQLRGVPFSEVIFDTTGKKMLPFDASNPV